MKTVHSDICDKIDRQTDAVAKLKASSSVIKKSEQDLEWKRKQVGKAIDNGQFITAFFLKNFLKIYWVCTMVTPNRGIFPYLAPNDKIGE